ncbi:MAG TPA: hypothetical protein VNA88_02175 [Candidatus Kapabacteria bacterium]|nr:hypothetical protein [Candidatus Kapabacteria bacterium]
MKHIPLTIIAGLALLAACDRSDIEEAQRSWLEEQHLLEKRLLEVRAEHLALRRGLDTTRVDDTADSASRERYERAVATLRDHEARLDAIDTVVDRHQLARDVAIRADDVAAVANARATATVDYETSMATLDSIDRQNDEIAEVLAGIRLGDAVDTAGPKSDSLGSKDGATSDTSAAGAPDGGTIDNTIGRDAPEEPGE